MCAGIYVCFFKNGTERSGCIRSTLLEQWALCHLNNENVKTVPVKAIQGDRRSSGNHSLTRNQMKTISIRLQPLYPRERTTVLTGQASEMVWTFCRRQEYPASVVTRTPDCPPPRLVKNVTFEREAMKWYLGLYYMQEETDADTKTRTQTTTNHQDVFAVAVEWLARLPHEV